MVVEGYLLELRKEKDRRVQVMEGREGRREEEEI